MDKKISEIMQKAVIVANVDDSIKDVESFITENQLSFLPVVDDQDRCFGVITDYDIIKFHKNKGNIELVKAWEICSYSIINIEKDISVLEASKILIDNKVHHLVIFENDVIEGIVSSIDLLRYFTLNEK